MKKDKSPAFRFYPADFLSDENVVIMSNQEVGCYIKLLCFCWREGSIPNDINKIAKLCGEDSSAMAQLWQNIEPCFNIESGRYFQKRLKKEKEKQKKFARERSESGKRGALKRWGKESSAMAQLSPTAIAELMAKNGFSFSFSFSIKYIRLTEAQYLSLCKDFGYEIIHSKIEDLELYIRDNCKGKDPYQDHNLTLRKWLKKDGVQKLEKKYFCEACKKEFHKYELKNGNCPVCLGEVK